MSTAATTTATATAATAGSMVTSIDMIMAFVPQYLLGTSFMTSEYQALTMAIQGCMIVRNTINKDGRQLAWFHAFVLSMLYGFAGGLLGFIWLGKPSSLLSNGDINLGATIVAYLLVNCTPYDIGYRLLNTLPLTILYTSGAQLFRATGIMKFVTACFLEFQHAPSPYYPIPVLGPILYGTLLGNMGGFLFKGVEGHVRQGVPWPIQNGLFCASWYHFIVHDNKGIIGRTLRRYGYPPMLRQALGWDDKTYAGLFVSMFMQITGLLQLPHFFGPTYSPFESISRQVLVPMLRTVTNPLLLTKTATTSDTNKQPSSVNSNVTTNCGGKKSNGRSSGKSQKKKEL